LLETGCIWKCNFKLLTQNLDVVFKSCITLITNCFSMQSE
jgi:hypothetical protein